MLGYKRQDTGRREGLGVPVECHSHPQAFSWMELFQGGDKVACDSVPIP